MYSIAKVVFCHFCYLFRLKWKHLHMIQETKTILRQNINFWNQIQMGKSWKNGKKKKTTFPMNRKQVIMKCQDATENSAPTRILKWPPFCTGWQRSPFVRLWMPSFLGKPVQNIFCRNNLLIQKANNNWIPLWILKFVLVYWFSFCHKIGQGNKLWKKLFANYLHIAHVYPIICIRN